MFGEKLVISNFLNDSSSVQRELQVFLITHAKICSYLSVQNQTVVNN
jgi:hypothetical protein